MTDEIRMLLESAAKIKQICKAVDDCRVCPFMQGGFCRFDNTSGESDLPRAWVIDWKEYED